VNDKVFYERASERHHQVAVENLAQSHHRSKEAVSTLYQMVLRHYSRTARIKYFLSALVTKRVQDVLRDDTLPPDVEGRRRHSQEL
jgi:hypothetical protein